MGTDIHFYVERMVSGKWVSCDTWEADEFEPKRKMVPYGGRFCDSRNYDLFAILADVRNGRGFAGMKTGEGFVPISEPRGLPADMSPELQAESDMCDHTPSWLLVSEIMAFDWTQRTRKSGVVDAQEFYRWRNWDRGRGLGPKSYSGGAFGAKVQMVDLDEMERRVSAIEKEILSRGMSHDRLRDEMATRLDHVYCQVEWETPYYRAAGEFLSECLPRLWRLGSASEVRCVFWFDS